MNPLWQNLRFSARMLIRQPGFSLVVILTLALGIGATTAIFSVVHGVALKPLSLPDSHRLQQVGWTWRGWLGGLDDAQFRHFREHQESFAGFAAGTGASFTLVDGGGGARVSGLHVSTGYFETLGVLPALGRPILEADDQVGAAATVVLSDGLWRSRYGADAGLLGRDVSLDGRPYRVIGIMPAGFSDYSGAQLWTPLAPVAASIGQGTNYVAIGRLREGVSPAQAQAEFEALAAAWMDMQGQDWPRDVGFAVTPLREALAHQVRLPLFLLLGATGFVLLIACANVANLMLARAQARTRELAIRAAVGASRGRLSQQVLVESLLLALLGAGFGLMLAVPGVELLMALQADALPRGSEVALDPVAFGFALLLALASGALAGLAPAWRAARRELSDPLKGIEAGVTRRRLPLPPLRSLLVGGQVALALVLLVGAGLLVQTFAHLARVDPGFAPERTLAAQFWTSGTRHGDTQAVTALHQRLAERALALPGVSAAGVVVAGLPLERGGNLGVRREGASPDQGFSADYRSISPGYLEALGTQILRGRSFSEADDAGAPSVAIVNEAFARATFEGGEALGQRLHVADGLREIVGVVADVRSFLDRPAPPTLFLPVAQSPHGTMALFEGWFPSHLVLRTELAPASLAPALAQLMREVDPGLPVGAIRPMEEVFAAALADRRFLASLMGAFSILALLLAAVGVYGVLSYSIGRRTREIGIQVALGAGREQVLRQVLVQGLRPVAAGMALGLLGAWALGGLMQGLLVGVASFDPRTHAAVVLTLALVAFAACLAPALRATRADPLLALRHE
jgi:putative ABC transport system permease protein